MSTPSVPLLNADELIALGRQADASRSCSQCGELVCPGWESMPGSFDRRQLQCVGTLRREDDPEPTLQEHHRRGTHAWSADAPIAPAFHPYNRCDVWQCAVCRRAYLRYTRISASAGWIPTSSTTRRSSALTSKHRSRCRCHVARIDHAVVRLEIFVDSPGVKHPRCRHAGLNRGQLPDPSRRNCCASSAARSARQRDGRGLITPMSLHAISKAWRSQANRSRLQPRSGLHSLGCSWRPRNTK
jgi:hypothetical protein